MKVLMISSNTLPASPSGPAYVAGAVRQAGHEVQVFESLFSNDVARDLGDRLRSFQPDVAGVSIRLVHGDVQDAGAPLGTRYVDLRPRVKQIVDVIRRNSGARIVLGGPGFNYYAGDWLNSVRVDYGIRGEGEVAFPQYLERLQDGGDIHSVPGCVYTDASGVHAVAPRLVEDLNGTALPAYDLFDLEAYAAQRVVPAILTKRGCAFGCTYCPYAKLEGRRYRLKSPERVLAEVHHILGHSKERRVTFCDNNFNAPRRHAEELCRAFMAAGAGADFEWSTGSLRPGGVTDDFCRLLRESRCYNVNLSVESASDTLLQRMKRGYTVRQVRESLAALSRSGIPFGASLLLGAPGETPATLAETLSVMGDYDIPLGVWVTLGVYLWTDLQDIVAEVRQAGWLSENESLFDGPATISKDLTREYLKELVSDLRSRPGYDVQVNRADAWL